MKQNLILIVALAHCALAADFSLAIGNPIAANFPGSSTAPIVKKTDMLMAVRAENCADPAKAQITGTAEGIVDGARRTAPLRLVAGSTPGVYSVIRDWPTQGAWVLSLTGVCGNSKAGAIVPIGPNGFVRESAKFLSRPATAAEIEASLKTLSGGAK